MNTPGGRRLHLAITTHTTRHLRRTLLAVASLRRKPDTVIVSCDNDREDVRDLTRACSGEFAWGLTAGIVLVQRPALGVCMLSQVRNNAVRALLARGATTSDAIIFHDGDCAPAADCAGTHEELLRRADLVCAFRVDLSPEQTEAFDETAVREGRPPAAVTEAQAELLEHRQARHERSLLLRRLSGGLAVKPHKPKILGANFALSLAAYDAVNGFDEEYVGYGSEDDDFSKRLYAVGVRSAVGVTRAVVYHQWHETRKPADWHDSPGVARFHRTLPSVCERGLRTPADQPPVREYRFIDGRENQAP